MSISTLQDTESGRTPRPQTAEKYARVLQRHGVDPNEVEEILAALGETFFVAIPPERRLVDHAMRSWDELTEGFVRAGYAERLREKLARIEREHGEEGRRFREVLEEEGRKVQAEEAVADEQETEE